jgi:REP element-mobilizing transposase RayT
MEAIVRPPVRATWGGRREGAGRKKAVGRSNAPHGPRELHEARHPVHVTLRLRGGLPSLRSERVRGMLRSILFGQRRRRYSDSFQVAEHTIQVDHIHLIVEASGPDAHRQLRSGVSGLMIAFAKRLNMMLKRRGKVWADRWHGRELRSPREVRNAVVYVFRSLAKHGTRMYGQGAVDRLSSAIRFTWWTEPLDWPFPDDPWPSTTPRTWLLGEGWRTRGGGPIDPREVRRMGA